MKGSGGTGTLAGARLSQLSPLAGFQPPSSVLLSSLLLCFAATSIYKSSLS